MDNLPIRSSDTVSQDVTKVNISKEWLDFINALRDEPDKASIKVNKFANDSKFIPIGDIENKLDYFFGGLWETKDFKHSVVVNEITCQIQLRVFHPVARVWIERTGTAAVQIQLKVEYEMKDGRRVKKDVDVTDVSKKIANTIQKDLPHAKAEAIKNAAKSLGKLFGRDLNRDDAEDGRQEIMSLEDMVISIESTDTKAALNDLWATVPKAMKSDKRVKTAFLKHQEFLKNRQ